MNSQVFFYNMKRINYNKQFTDEKDAQIVLEAIKSKLELDLNLPPVCPPWGINVSEMQNSTPIITMLLSLKTL